MCFKRLKNVRKEEPKEADQTDQGDEAGKNAFEYLPTEHQSQKSPGEVPSPQVKPQRDSRDLQNPTYADWKVGSSLFRIFCCPYHRFRLFF
jgi:hypothetical protein